MQSTKTVITIMPDDNLPSEQYYKTINADMILRTKIFRFLERVRKIQKAIDNIEKVENTLQKLAGVAL